MANRDPNPVTRFRKGQSGNPGGRKKTKPFTDALTKELEGSAHGGDQTRLDMGVARLVQMFMAGDINAAKLVIAYYEGLPTQKIDLKVEAARLAEQYGLDADELLRDAEAIIANASLADG
ncbi:MAG: hypothetical protein H0V51_26200 [Chloroflexi bacterium]|nr:hypothetical protein [Chloroflexota bacterium]